MRKKTKLKTGEFSQMMQVTVKTLRHYEQKGLLYPYEVDRLPLDIDIEYCEQVEVTGTDNAIIQFKRLDAEQWISVIQIPIEQYGNCPVGYA